MRWLNLVFVLLVNAVPIYGVKVLGWSIGTVLLLFWIENLLIAVFTCARIVLHRVLTRKAGHYRSGGNVSVNGKTMNWGLFGEYAIIAFPFTLVHGIFVAAIVFLIAANKADAAEWHFSGEQFRFGAEQMLLVMAVDFLLDAFAMRRRSFAWIKAYADQRTGRILILHLGIIFGMWGMAASDSPMSVLYAILALKVLWDLATGSATARAAPLPERPPDWALKLADRIDRKKGGSRKMTADWQRSAEAQRRRALEDEAVVSR